jgi:hypothetical protein
MPAATAAEPQVMEMPLHTEQPYGGCDFPVTFTGDGVLRITTFEDASGTPVRQTVHGSLHHTLYSPWETLHSPGPAGVHTDLTTGQSVLTGLQYRFQVPGEGVILATAGRMVVDANWTLVSFSGLERLDADAICEALAP